MATGDERGVTMYYRIENTHGLTGGRWNDTFATLPDAADGLRKAMGWDHIWLSGRFNDGDGWSVCGYETEADLDKDGDGARAPRIVEVKEEE